MKPLQLRRQLQWRLGLAGTTEKQRSTRVGDGSRSTLAQHQLATMKNDADGKGPELTQARHPSIVSNPPASPPLPRVWLPDDVSRPKVYGQQYG